MRRAGVASKTLPGFSGAGGRWTPPHSYDHIVRRERRNETKRKCEVTERVGERDCGEAVNASDAASYRGLFWGSLFCAPLAGLVKVIEEALGAVVG